jgi:hypothetical protein
MGRRGRRWADSFTITRPADGYVIAFSLFMPLGALVLRVGLLRGRSPPWWHAVQLAVSIGVVTPLALGVQSLVDGVRSP